MNPVRLLVLLTLFLSVVCNAEDLGKDFSELQDRGINGYFEKNQEIGYTGDVFEKHPNGQIKTLGKLIKGKWDGLERHWYSDGQKQMIRNWKDGKMHGKMQVWHSNGNKKYEGNYKDGKADGLLQRWHKNEQKEQESNYKDGKKVEGSEKFWSSKGEPVDSEEE